VPAGAFHFAQQAAPAGSQQTRAGAAGVGGSRSNVTCTDAATPFATDAYDMPFSRDDGWSRNAGNASSFELAPIGFDDDLERKRHHRHRVAAVVATCIVVILVAVGITGYSLYQDVNSLKADAAVVQAQLPTVQSSLTSGDADSAKDAVSAIDDAADRMKATTDKTTWKMASRLPGVGTTVSEARTLCSVLDDLSNNALVPMMDDLSGVSLSSLILPGHAIDVDQLQRVFDAVNEAAPVVSRANTQISSLQPTGTSQIDSAITSAGSALGKLDQVMTSVNEFSQVAPSMLGTDGTPRVYLLVAQNNAEVHATGGLAGSVGELTVVDGVMSLGDFVSMSSDSDLSSYLGSDDRPSITDEETEIFGTRLNSTATDMNYTPDFTRFAEILSQAWVGIGGDEPDGVIAIDPVVLQDVLSLVGGVAAPNGTTIDGTNAATELLHNAYDGSMTPTQEDQFFSAVAALSFQKVFDNIGNVSPLTLANTVKDNIAGYHVFAWSDDATVEEYYRELGCAGELSRDETDPQLGVFFNDDTWSKASWYLSASTTVSNPVRNADGSRTYQVTTVLHNNIDTASAQAEIDYVTGYNDKKRDVTDMIDWIYLVAPAGGSISNVSVSGYMQTADDQNLDSSATPQGEMVEATLEGHDIWFGSTQMLGGDSTTVTYTVTTSPSAQTDSLSVRQTPTLQDIAGWGSPA
jgi:hypothetical protein